MPLVTVEDLAIAFSGSKGWHRVVDGVSLWLEEGETLGLVGASGSGKTLTLLSILNLVPPPGRVEAGRIEVNGVKPLEAPESVLRQLRGGSVGLVMQAPAGAFNPVMSVGFQVAEAAFCHGNSRGEAKSKALELLAAVGLEPPEHFYRAFPHQLSGGELQRALLAAALAGNPKVLLLDEPTSALDPLAQNAFLALLQGLRQAGKLSLVVTSHDLSLVSRESSRVAVLARGETVEFGPAHQVFTAPLHPATRALCGLEDELAARPALPVAQGCRFARWCSVRMARCIQQRPALEAVGEGRLVRCFLHHDRVEHG
ncbi:MAG: ABC transporter ATP-binding protein [Thermoanaerobaculaceae bacterium]